MKSAADQKKTKGRQQNRPTTKKRFCLEGCLEELCLFGRKMSVSSRNARKILECAPAPNVSFIVPHSWLLSWHLEHERQAVPVSNSNIQVRPGKPLLFSRFVRLFFFCFFVPVRLLGTSLLAQQTRAETRFPCICPFFFAVPFFSAFFFVLGAV